MLTALSILIAWMIARLRASRRAASHPESRTPGSGIPHGGTLPRSRRSH